VNLLQVLAQAAYWFHPFVWWANRRIRQEREKCCDEMAVAHLNTPPEHYTRAIVDTLATERRSAHPVPSLAIVGSVKDIEERIRTMLKPGKTFRRRPSLVAAMVASLIALITIPTALALTARDPTQAIAQSITRAGAIRASIEEPGLPRYAARTFSSKAALDVRVCDKSNSQPRPVGQTPSPTPVQIPACWLWLVKPVAPVEDWDLVIKEVSQNHIPGLWLNRATDADLERLAGLGELEFLVLTDAQITDDGLAYLKGLTGLWGLHLSGAKITGAGLAHLKDLTGLYWLDLVDDAAITDAGWQGLEGWRGLRRLGLVQTPITDAGLEHLKDLTGLEALDLYGMQVTDAGLAHLRGLIRLRDLNLTQAPISDAGLAQLKDLTGLQVLNLNGTQITDAGLAYLKNLTGLQRLNLSGTRITDAGLACLKDLTGLRDLKLGEGQITDAGLVYLKGLTGLQLLSLGKGPITDGGLEYLKGLPHLRYLHLQGTQITDAGLEHLKGLAELEYLNVYGTQVTRAGAARLKQSLPKLGDDGFPPDWWLDR